MKCVMTVSPVAVSLLTPLRQVVPHERQLMSRRFLLAFPSSRRSAI